jgi:hypothetical protein
MSLIVARSVAEVKFLSSAVLPFDAPRHEMAVRRESLRGAIDGHGLDVVLTRPWNPHDPLPLPFHSRLHRWSGLRRIYAARERSERAAILSLAAARHRHWFGSGSCACERATLLAAAGRRG